MPKIVYQDKMALRNNFFAGRKYRIGEVESYSLKFGFCAPNYGKNSSPELVQQSTLLAERLGYDSVWLTDHILLPRNSGTPYERTFETITTLAYLSGITRRIRLGISSLILPMRNPVVVAKQISNLDVLSGGRAMLCVGSGWSKQEYEFLGSDFHDRGRRLNESMLMLRSLWSGRDNFQGKFIAQNYSNANIDPKTLQESIPLWVAGLSPAAMVRAVAFGDAWHPNAHPINEFKDLVGRFRSIQGAHTRNICVRMALNTKLEKTGYLDKDGKERILLCSDKVENRRILVEFEKLGVNYIVVVPASVPFFAGEIFEDNSIEENLKQFAEQTFSELGT